MKRGTFVGREVLPLGVYDAIASFNIERLPSINVLENLGVFLCQYCQATI